MCGIGSGGFFALQSAIVSQILGSHRVNAGISWLEVGGSFGYLAGPISAGALLDAFGGADDGAAPYRPAMVRHSSKVWVVCSRKLITCLTASVLGRRLHRRRHLLGHQRAIEHRQAALAEVLTARRLADELVGNGISSVVH